MQITTLIIVITVLLLPVVTIYNKFDLLRKFLFTKFNTNNQNKIVLPQLNFSFAVLSKLLALSLVGLKLYFSLYIILYMITNHVWISTILGVISLGLLIIILYSFWKLKPSWQNKIINVGGFAVSMLFFAILLGTILISLISIFATKNLFDTLTSRVLLKDCCFALITTIVGYFLGTFVSNNIINDTSNKIIKKFYLFTFNLLGNIPSIVLGSLQFFIINGFFPQFYSDIADNKVFFGKLILSSVIQGIICSPIIVRKVTKRREVNFMKIFFKFFFEANLLINLLFFALNSPGIMYSNGLVFSQNYLTLLLDKQNINSIGFLLFILYLVYFIFVKQGERMGGKSIH